ncbi:type II toxin-antitoxin system Phd/YefM family antitoxin [Phyllobacterium lublinensis]|jgi:prevent-host-death family protein|uniref:type II toxin-antitoxin system Phd/YefM family antitoxin n=1 Tax=Phyllobacterium lublinensis TaxID=2875708 RepID=UPI001CC95852|nr:type II toxin-antitoxin system Phd/YefM family antitoxin [Phyllobacterium sp. 2063]MBZ9654831.1 type II toxin-antitoxin system Phd/YefM family antitoxin [Phyllobacterium sp. 2063]
MEKVNLYDAKTNLSNLVDRAAAGEEVIIAKNGVPLAKLGPLPKRDAPRKPANALQVTYIADDFDAVDAEIEALFG